MYMISNTEHYSGKNEASEGNQKHCKKKPISRGRGGRVSFCSSIMTGIK